MICTGISCVGKFCQNNGGLMSLAPTILHLLDLLNGFQKQSHIPPDENTHMHSLHSKNITFCQEMLCLTFAHARKGQCGYYYYIVISIYLVL